MISIGTNTYGGAKGMITMIDKGHIIRLVESGKSYRQVSKETGIHRKTVAKYFQEHKRLQAELEEIDCPVEVREIQNKIISQPSYPSRKKVLIKWTEEMDQFLDNQLDLEKDRDLKFGINHKQRITNVMVHELMLQEGFKIGLSSVQWRMKEKRSKIKEVFIRQTYEPAQRFEFDYGEVWLMIKGIKTKCHLAVISSPYSNYRIAYLYSNQDQRTFLDAHLKLFNEIGGIPKEIVYDNMKNVVTKFIGKSEKQLNQKLVQLSMYYGFEINVTNCFSGNEKGHVEGSVKFIRNKVFTTHYEFESIDDAETHLALRLIKLNTESKLEDERPYLRPLKTELDIADVCVAVVNKYSTVRIENNFYSVPEALVSKQVTVKNYLRVIEVYFNHKKVCEHNKKDGYSEYIIDIMHYLRTFNSKPGALKNSTALVNNTDLKTIFDKYYTTQPKLFITLITDNKHKSREILNELLLDNSSIKAKSSIIEDNIISAANTQINYYNQLLRGNKNNGRH